MSSCGDPSTGCSVASTITANRSRAARRSAALTPAGSVEHYLVVPPEPFEQEAGRIALGFARKHLADGALPVDRLEQPRLARVYGEKDVGMRMSPIDEYRGDAGWQPFPHGYCVWPADWGVSEPAIVMETDPRDTRIVVAVRDRTMAHHVAAK